MRVRPFVTALLLIIGIHSLPASADDLEARLREMSQQIDGRVSLYARNLDSGRDVAINADEPVRTASTIKLPIACAVAKFVADGRHAWSDRLTIRAEDKVSGSGVLADFSDGESISLRDATTLMIIVSDNTATNLILDRVGGDPVNEYLASLGLERTRVMRKIRGDGNQLKPAQGWTREGVAPRTSALASVCRPREKWFVYLSYSSRGSSSIAIRRKLYCRCSSASNTRTASAVRPIRFGW